MILRYKSAKIVFHNIDLYRMFSLHMFDFNQEENIP